MDPHPKDTLPPLKGADLAGPEGRHWHQQLPQLITSVARDWQLAVAAPFPNLSYNYVAPATQSHGTAVVLKLYTTPSQEDFQAEVAALQAYDGDGAVRLLRLDQTRRALLLEAVNSERDSWQVAGEQERVAIAAAIMKRLWRPAPTAVPLLSAEGFFQRALAVAPGITPPGFPLERLKEAQAIFEELAASALATLLHGDLHQANIIAAKRQSWLAIDPHGLVGPPVFNTGPFILNAVWAEPDPSAWPGVIQRHVAAFAKALGFEREQVRLAGLARSSLNAVWTLEETGDCQRDLTVAAAFAHARS